LDQIERLLEVHIGFGQQLPQRLGQSSPGRTFKLVDVDADRLWDIESNGALSIDDQEIPRPGRCSLDAPPQSPKRGVDGAHGRLVSAIA
jgi:hypothetical protein